ncbi:spartin a isoform X2 [Dunckerocampus dactyliophorus]|uniref:spartin a isoform X2 n=1 Tax=Dunckerocampus dactyliophorus TaxID=161453 RepID=UPI002404EFC1|nr:spartin a isoform X2 [Dunckerocampus dactyliophorus]
MSEPAELLLIKDQYELAFHCLSRGLSLEEGGDSAKAEEYYRKGQQHLMQGLGVPTGGPRQTGPLWERARELQQRMKGTLATVSTHISDLGSAHTPPPGQRQRLLMELTPSLYPLLPAHSPLQHLYPSIPPASQGPAAAAAAAAAITAADPNTLPPLPARKTQPTMSESQVQPPAYTPQPADGHHSLAHTPAPGEWSGAGLEKRNELLLIPAGVQMFFVAPSGQVSALSHPGYLRIVTFEPQHQDPPDGRGPFFLDVCGWLYSLSPQMPVLLASSEIFMFPDTLASVPGAFIGIVLSSQLPAADREMFQDLMKQLTDFRVQVLLPGKDKAPLPTWSEKMGEGILSGATRLGHGLVRGAEATTRAINKGALKIRERLTPEDTPSEVSPHVSRSLQVAKQATDGAVRVSHFLVNGVSTVAEHLAEKVAPHLKKHGAKLIPESMKGKEGEPSNLEGAKFVALSSLQGFSAVWTSLEMGAKLVGTSVTSETVQTVTYKYGDDAGQATDTALQSATNVAVTAHNIDNLGIKAIMKTTGKEAAKAMFKRSDAKNTDDQQETAIPEQEAAKDTADKDVKNKKVEEGKK